MKNRILSALTALVLVLSMFVCTAAAEEAAGESAINLRETWLTVGENTYVLPISVADLTDMGVNVPDVTGLTEGTYYPTVDVDDGRNGFSLTVSYLTTTDDPYWATGFSLSSENHAGLNASGMILGETTMGEVVAAMGPAYNTSSDGTQLTYYYYDLNVSWNLIFDGTSESSKLTHVILMNNLVSTYGVMEAPEAAEDAPSASELSFDQFILEGVLYQKGDTLQTMLDNGWVMPANRVGTTIAAIDGNKMSGDVLYLYNGASMVKVYAYNSTSSECTVEECGIHEVVVSTELGSNLVCADGLEIGDSYEEAAAILGEPASTQEKDGMTEYSFTVINNVKYTLGVQDGVVISIDIRGLI